jgi:hypothetical protein
MLLLVPSISAQTAGEDSATGSGFATDEAGNGFFFDFGAVSGPSGENPTGTSRVSTTFTGGIFAGSVTCLVVEGNSAVIGINATESPFPNFGYYIFAEDAGPPGSGLDTFYALSASANPQDCETATQPPDTGTYVVRGSDSDIAVHDASPFPTAKEQCKNGAWRAYGDTFKNQGQCVAFVQRGPKP